MEVIRVPRIRWCVSPVDMGRTDAVFVPPANAAILYYLRHRIPHRFFIPLAADRPSAAEPRHDNGGLDDHLVDGR